MSAVSAGLARRCTSVPSSLVLSSPCRLERVNLSRPIQQHRPQQPTTCARHGDTARLARASRRVSSASSSTLLTTSREAMYASPSRSTDGARTERRARTTTRCEEQMSSNHHQQHLSHRLQLHPLQHNQQLLLHRHDRPPLMQPLPCKLQQLLHRPRVGRPAPGRDVQQRRVRMSRAPAILTRWISNRMLQEWRRRRRRRSRLHL